MTVEPVLEPVVCRLCGGECWSADEDGPVHSCCKVLGVQGPNGRCPSCAASRAYEGNFYSRQARAAETTRRTQ
ncbi:MAG: hypothetical protein ACRDXE_10730 [Acidimicrobiales bacterium]